MDWTWPSWTTSDPQKPHRESPFLPQMASSSGRVRQSPHLLPPALRTKPHANSISQHLIRKKKMTGSKKTSCRKKRGANRVCRSMDRGWVPPRRQKNKGVRHCHLCPSRRAQGRAAGGEWSGAHRPRRRSLAARPGGGESGAPRPRSGPGRSLIQALQASENTAWEEAQAQPEKSRQASVSAAEP